MIAPLPPRIPIYTLIVLGAILSLAQPTMAQCTQVPNGLVVWLTGSPNAQGQAYDLVGQNNVTLQNGATFASGKVGQAFSLDGVDDFVQIAAPIYSAAGGTVDLWFKRTGSGRLMIGSYGGSGVKRAPTLSVTPGGTLGWEFGSLGSQDTGITINQNQFYHAALTYDSNFNVKVYLNGALVGQGTSTNPGGFYNEVDVGHYPNSSFFFTGLIDEVHFYNRALTQAEIQAIVTADSAGFCRVANDNFANAQTLSSTSSGTVSGNNVRADSESGEPGHTGPAALASVWYSWTAPSNGTVTFNTTGSNFDTLLAAYVGTSLATLSKVASNDDAGGGALTSSITFNTTSGTTYRIAVDGKNGQNGQITLNWSSAGSVSTASITGRVTNVNGVIDKNAASGVLLNDSISPTVNADGTYTFTGLAPTGTYTLTINANNGISYAPFGGLTITLRGNVIADDFVATTPSFTVSGTVRDPNNNPLVGATVVLSGTNLKPFNIITNSSGQYTSPALNITGNYTFTPRPFITATGITYATYDVPHRDYTSIGPCGTNCDGFNYLGQDFKALNNPAPTVTNTSPTSAAQGGSGTTLTVNGTSFINGSTIRFNGGDRITTFVSATQLTTQLNAADLQTAGTQTVNVFTPTPGGGTSNSVNFTVTGTSATLRLDTVSPPAGRTSGGQTLTLTGSFTGLSSVMIGGVAVTFSGSASQITITTPAHLAGAVQIDLVPTSGSTVSKPNAFAYLPTTFTDNTLTVKVTTAKAQHILELRQAVDALRAVAGLTGASWTDPTLTPTATKIKAVHVQELRTFLDDAATRLGYSTAPYTDPSLSGIVIKRIHIEELRQRIRNIAG